MAYTRRVSKSRVSKSRVSKSRTNKRRSTQRGGQTPFLKRNSGSKGSRQLLNNRESTRNALELIETYKDQGMSYNQMRTNLYEIEMTNPLAQKITSAARRLIAAEDGITNV
jgi:hypothetical protein